MAPPEYRRKALYLKTLMASTALASNGAHAQSSDDDARTPAAARDQTIDEIVVRGVARRFRPEEQSSATGLDMALIDTPQAVSVLTTEMMETVNAKSVYEATDLVPNVQRSGFGFGLEQIVMRGIFNGDRRVNGIEFGPSFLTSVNSYASERVEVVRGPATAIYGVTGSFGGELNTILKRPLAERRVELGVEGGSYDSQRYSLDASTPLNSEGTLSGRFATEYREYDLPLDIRNEAFPNSEFMAFSALQWDVTGSSTLNLSHLYQRRDIDPWDGGALIQNDDGTLSIPDVDPEQWYFSHPDQSHEDFDVHFVLAEFEHEFANGLRTRTQTSWSQWEENLAYFFPFGPFGAYALADDEVYIFTYDVERNGEEFTFNQTLTGDFRMLDRDHQFLLAVEYIDALSPNRFELLNSFFQGFATIDIFSPENFDGGTPRFSDGSPFLPIEGDREELFGVRQELLETTEDLKFSGMLLLNPIERLEILGGMIFHKNDTVTRIPINRGVVNDPPTRTKTSFAESAYRAGVTYDLLATGRGAVDDVRVYYNYSEGFQPQTFTDGDGNTVSAPQEMDQHEVGIKAELFGGAVGTSVALFDYEITNIEVSSSFLGSFGGFGSTVLEGTQEATGLEWDLVGELLPGWNVTANYAWMDAEILNPNNTRGTPPRTTPTHSGAITTTYEFLDSPLAGLRIGATFKASGDYSFVEGTSNVDRFGEPPDAGSHERVDLHFSYAPRAGRFANAELYFTALNIFDEDIIVAKQGNPGFGIMFIDQQRFTAGLRYTFE